MHLVTVKLQVKDIRVRKPVPELPEPDSKADRCLCTDVSRREDSPAEIQKKS